MKDRNPTIALVGPGRCGKDTAGAWFSANTPLRCTSTSSTSRLLLPHVRRLHYAGDEISDEDLYASRLHNRQLWVETGWLLKQEHGPECLIRWSLQENDIVIGLRDREELLVSLDSRLLDLVVWIDRPGCSDHTQGFGPELADIIVPNTGTLDDFYYRLNRFGNLVTQVLTGNITR